MDDYDLKAPEIDLATPLLITGANGFVGRNLAARLKAEGFTALCLYDVDTPEGKLGEYAARARFVFHLAGVNRPQENEEFYTGNSDFTRQLAELLAAAETPPPVVLSSSAQAGNGTDYAKSKQRAESAVFDYGRHTGAPVYVYRLPGVFGKWSRPNYNSVVATFCHNTARGLPIEVRDPAYSFPLCYIDDVVDSFISKMCAHFKNTAAPAAGDNEDGEPVFLGIDPTYEVTLGWLAAQIRSFAATRQNLTVPDMADGVTRKLWATYLSFLPPESSAYPLAPRTDERGSFTEVLRTLDRGQVSVNVARPGVTKGNHWHDTKNEKFLVVSGRAVVRLRPIGGTAVTAYEISAEKPTVVDILPGYTHNIENVGDTDLVTLMWASSPFDKDNPDTWYEEV